MKSHTLRNVFHLVICGLILQVGLHTANGQSTLAQERIPVDLKNFQLNLNILEPGLSFEQKVNDNQSISMTAGITVFTVEDENYDNKDDFFYSFNPFITGSFQHYYQRKFVRKELRQNSGNFIGVSAGYYFDAIADNLDHGTTTERANSFTIGPVWGIQRNYQSGIHLKLSLGPGIGFGENAESDVFFAPAGGFEFGFVIK